MAGGVLKTFGGLFLTLGILGLLGGLGALGYGFFSEKENQDNSGPLGVAHDRGQAEDNEQLMVGGGVAAGAGLVLLIVGIALLAGGGSRSRNQLVRAALERPQGAGMNGSAPGAPSGASSGASSGVSTGPSSVPPAKASATPPSPARRNTVAGAVLLALIVLGVVAAVAWQGDLAAGPAALPQQAPLATQTVAGSVAAGFTVGGNSNMADSSPAAFKAPAPTTRLAISVAWQPGDLCCEQLELQVEQSVEGAWKELASFTGPSGVTQDVAIDLSKGDAFRVRAFPGQDGVSEGQDFEVTVGFWA